MTSWLQEPVHSLLVLHLVQADSTFRNRCVPFLYYSVCKSICICELYALIYFNSGICATPLINRCDQ